MVTFDVDFSFMNGMLSPSFGCTGNFSVDLNSISGTYFRFDKENGPAAGSMTLVRR